MDVFIRDFHLGTQSETQYADTKGWIVAIVTAGSVAGCMSCIWITQALRRPRAFQLFTAVYIVGVVGQAVSKGSLAGLYASRVVAGFGIGGTTVLAPIYIAGVLSLSSTRCLPAMPSVKMTLPR